jgi:hypothetical protein
MAALFDDGRLLSTDDRGTIAEMRVASLGLLLILWGCGGHPPPPKRGVVEGDLGSWKYRRYQSVLDIEVWVEGNKAEAYTASYVAEDAEKRARCCDDKDVVNVFVTRYEKDDGILRETVKLARRLAAEGGYQVEETKISGARALSISGHGEAWVMWPSKKSVVKVGGRGRDSVPESMVASYVARDPSVLPGGSLEGPLPGGPEPAQKQDKEEYDPNAPRPDLDKYDPKKSKLPDKKKDK